MKKGISMRKFKMFIDYDKEEKWLNEMAKKGYELKSVFLGYKFHYINPKDSIIRIDYRTFSDKRNFVDYCTLFEDSGWKHIAGTRSSEKQYFKKVNINSQDDIFSDTNSKLIRYKKSSSKWLTLGLANIPMFIALIHTNTIDINAIFNPKLLYYTSGLWQMKGSEFWRHFLFETPFAVMRGFTWIIFVVMDVCFLYFSIKSMYIYKTRKTII